MTNERFSYQVVDIKGGLWGIKPQKVQDELNRLGLQGWELVSVVPAHGALGLRLFLKKSH